MATDYEHNRNSMATDYEHDRNSMATTEIAWPLTVSITVTISEHSCAGPLSGDYSSSFANQKAFNAPGNSPKMWSELWVGWFTVWGDAHAANKTAAGFRSGVGEMVGEGASFSLYMAHGGALQTLTFGDD
jgi:hypothetical protein